MTGNGQAGLLIASLRDPAVLEPLDEQEWDRLIRQARHAGVLSRIGMLAREAGAQRYAPPRAEEQLLSARLVADRHERSVRWEVSRIQRVLRDHTDRTVLLKGAAYVMADLPPRVGRLVSDVDVLFPKAQLNGVEQALLHDGWETMKIDAYDQRYYRQWMHELPPLRHSTRGTVVDVHHTILPPTARLQPDADKLLSAAVSIGDGLATLAPEDMVLHSATHLFVDGDLAGGLRDLVDIDLLLRHFGETHPGFWERIVPRSRELDLDRPLYYALRYAHRWLDTPVPESAFDELAASGPPWPARKLMDRLAARALVPPDGGLAGGGSAARWMLYVRSHWARMPPRLLVQHLGRKAGRRWFGKSETNR